MPPCSWMASWLMWRPDRPIWNLARAALTVEGAVRVAADCLTVDQEQTHSAVGQLRADDQGVGRVAGQHRILVSGQRPRITLLHSGCLDRFDRSPARTGLQVSERQQ